MPRRWGYLYAFVASLLLISEVNAQTDGDRVGQFNLISGANLLNVEPSSGSAQTSYAFAVPPGRLSLQPSLAMHYNSLLAQQGFVGRGWQLDFPSVVRTTRRGEGFPEKDILAVRWEGRQLDLMAPTDIAVGVKQYLTALRTSLRIRSVTSAGITTWEIADGSGLTYQFGGQLASGGWAQIPSWQWALTRVEDAHGNYMVFDWLVDSGMLYPKEIRYTGNTAGDAPTNRVEFAYEGRYDVVDTRLGPDALLRYRLRRIRTWAGSEPVAVYLLDYSTPSTGDHPIDLCLNGCAPTTRICPDGSVSTCTGTCDPSTGFCAACTPFCNLCAGVTCLPGRRTCPNGSVQTCTNTCNPNTGQCSSCIPDLCVKPCNKKICPEQSTKMSDVTETPWAGVVESLRDSHEPLLASAIMSPALDAQLITSAVGPTPQDETSLLTRITAYDGLGRASLPATTFTYQAEVQEGWEARETSLPEPFVRSTCRLLGPPWPEFDRGVQVADVNRDGLADIVRGFRNQANPSSDRGVWLRNRDSQGGGWSPAPQGTWVMPQDFVIVTTDGLTYDNGLRFLDMNGDGLEDLAHRVHNEKFGYDEEGAWINSGNGWVSQFPFGSYLPEPVVAIKDGRSRDLGVRFGDVNGDGLVDVVRAFEEEGAEPLMRVYLNRRTRFELISTWTMPAGFVHYYPGYGRTIDAGVRLVDINGDGLADIVKSINWFGAPIRAVWLNDGTSWQPATLADWETIPTFASATTIDGKPQTRDLGVRFGDVNGDGRLDMFQSLDYFDTSGLDPTRKVYIHRGGKGWVEDPAWSATIPFPFIFASSDGANDNGVRVADVNGDGTTDLLRGVNGEGCFSQPGQVYQANLGAFTEIMTRNDNGIGGATSLKYISSGMIPTYDREPVLTNLIIPAVSEMTVSDGQTGTGHTLTTKYQYRGAVYHYGQREFRGFRYRRTDLPGGEAYIEQLFVRDLSRDTSGVIGAVEQEALRRASDNRTYSFVFNNYTIDFSAPQFDYLQSSGSYLYDWSTTGFEDLPRVTPARKATVKWFRYEFSPDGWVSKKAIDDYLSEIHCTAAGCDPPALSTTEEYINDTGTWRIGLLRERYVTDPVAATGTKLSDSWFYYDDQALGNVSNKSDLTQVEIWNGDPSEGRGSPNNRLTTFRYDSRGRLTKTIDPAGHESFADYGIRDLTGTFVDRARVYTNNGGEVVEHATDYEFDARFGALTKVTTPGDGSVSTRLDTFGRPVKSWSSLDSENLPTSCTVYDLTSRPVRTFSFVRETVGVGEACGPAGMLGSASFFDGMSRPVQTKSESGEPGSQSVVSDVVEFDAAGRAVKAYQPFYSTTPFTQVDTVPATIPAGGMAYDAIGRLTRSTLPGTPADRVIDVSYSDWTTTILDPERKRTDTTLDEYGRIARRISFDDAGGAYTTISYDFDKLGRLRGIRDYANNALTYEYNGFGDLVHTLDPDGGERVNEYDREGLLSWTADYESGITSFAYDALHRVLTRNRSNGFDVSYRYDEAIGRPGGPRPIGHITSATDGLSSIGQEFRYDALGRQVGMKESISGVTYEVSQDLDDLGRVTRLTYPDHSSLGFGYRLDGLLGSVESFASNLSYNAGGKLLQADYANGLRLKRTYDDRAQWLSNIKAWFPATGQTLVDTTIGRNQSGYVTSLQDAFTVAGQPRSQTFGLDHQYRLKSADSPGSYGHLDFVHDALGNLRFKGNTQAGTGVTFYYDDPSHPHQMTGTSAGEHLSYSAVGNLNVIEGSPGSGSRMFTYNEGNRVVWYHDQGTGRNCQYLYDPQESRAVRYEFSDDNPSSVSRTVYIGDLYEEGPDGYKKYVHLGSERIAEWRGDGSKVFFTDDQVGSIGVATDGTGALLSRIEYAPYGEVTAVQSAGYSIPFRFAGARSEDGKDLHDFGARMYDAYLARFVAIDPVITNPLSAMDLNPYSYARGNPVSMRDYGGFSPTDEYTSIQWCFLGYCTGSEEGWPDGSGTIVLGKEGQINVRVSPSVGFRISWRMIRNFLNGEGPPITDDLRAVYQATGEVLQEDLLRAHQHADDVARFDEQLRGWSESGVDPSYCASCLLIQGSQQNSSNYSQTLARDPDVTAIENLVLEGAAVAEMSALDAVGGMGLRLPGTFLEVPGPYGATAVREAMEAGTATLKGNTLNIDVLQGNEAGLEQFQKISQGLRVSEYQESRGIVRVAKLPNGSKAIYRTFDSTRGAGHVTIEIQEMPQMPRYIKMRY